jgi:ABC-type branched-subunit amino acid transport system substrate-binding protein
MRSPRCSLLGAAWIGLASLTASGIANDPDATRGQQVYLHGISASGQEIVAVLGAEGTPVRASVVPCANCHGHDGRGRPEGGITPANITWEVLTKPYGVIHADGRRHGPYTERLLTRAITMGIDPAGERLHAAMPRYRLSQQDAADLIAYMKTLGTARDPGVTDDAIRVGAIVPSAGRLAESGAAVQAVLTAYFDRVNKGGGVYARRIEARFMRAPEADDDRLEAVESFVREQQVFALVSSFLAGADKEISALLDRRQIPLVGTFTLTPELGFPLNRYVFHLHQGVKGEVEALAAFAARRYAGGKVTRAIVVTDEALSQDLARTLRDGLETTDPILEIRIARQQFDTASVVRQIDDRRIDAVFLVAVGAPLNAIVKEAHGAGRRADFFIPGSLATQEVMELPADLTDRVFLALPTLSSDATAEGLAEYRSLAASYALPSHHQAEQLAALSSAKILVEGLRRAGREASRESLVQALEGLYDFRTGLLPGVTFGPNRRVGILPARVVKLDPAARKLVPVGPDERGAYRLTR